jgi:hypothetical protein
MLMWSKYAMVLGSIVIGLMGTMHLLYTFFTNKFNPKNLSLIREMRNTSPILSDGLNFWKAWVGFNASHSSGIIFMAIMNIFLVTRDFSWISSSNFFFLFNILTMAFYVFMVKRYWFRPPMIGAFVTLLCYCASYFLVIAERSQN